MKHSGFHLSYDDVYGVLDEIFRKNSGFCKFDVDYALDPLSDNGKISYDGKNPVGSRFYRPIRILVGTSSLKENMRTDGMVRDRDAVRSIFEACHESVHLWQYSVAYMQPSDSVPESTKYMAQDKVIGDAFPEYRKMMYVLDTSELFADMRASSTVKSIFVRKALQNPNFGCVDIDKHVCDLAREKYGPVWKGIEASNTVAELISAYSAALPEAAVRKRLDEYYLNKIGVRSRSMRRLLNDATIMGRLRQASDGVAENDVLCRYIGSNYPSRFRGVLCIRPDYVSKEGTFGARVVDTILNIGTQEYRDMLNDGSTIDEDELE